MRVERETAAPGRTDRPRGLEIHRAWNDHSGGPKIDRGHGTTQNGTDRVLLERPRGSLETSDTDGSGAARSLCFPQRDKRRRNPSFLLKNSQDYFGMATVLSSAKSQVRA